MQYTIFTVAALAAAAIAAPTTAVKRTAADGINPNVIFTDATCKLGTTLIGYPPLGNLFPSAELLGSLLGQTLVNAIGESTLNDIDVVAEDVCISADQDYADGAGVCNHISQAAFDLISTDLPTVAKNYKCLLNAICIAQATPNNEGTCQFLLAGADCVANRIIGEMGNAAECNGTFPQML